jgi:preprotein translocase subunit Sss1
MIAVAIVAPVLGIAAWYKKLSEDDREEFLPLLVIGAGGILLSGLMGFVLPTIAVRYYRPDGPDPPPPE